MNLKCVILAHLLLIDGKEFLYCTCCTHQHVPVGGMLNDYALKWKKEFKAEKAALVPEILLSL